MAEPLSSLLSPLSSLRRAQPLSFQQKVALAVIEQAFKDAADRGLTPAVRSEARRFVARSAMLGRWCDVARLDHAFVGDVTAKFLRGLFDVVSPGQPVRRHGREAGTGRAVRSRGHERTAAAGMSASVVALRVSSPGS